jgi:hypothetical protein
MIIEISNRIAEAAEVVVNGKKWNLLPTEILMKRSYVFDNGRFGWEADKLELDENGYAKIYVGRDNGYVNYRKLSYDVIRMDFLKLDFQHDMVEYIGADKEYTEVVSRSVSIAIENCERVSYIQFEKDNGTTKSYERFYFDKDSNPSGYSSPYISGPSWNENRNFDMINSINSYFAAIYEYIPTLRVSYSQLRQIVK